MLARHSYLTEKEQHRPKLGNPFKGCPFKARLTPVLCHAYSGQLRSLHGIQAASGCLEAPVMIAERRTFLFLSFLLLQ